MLVEGDEYENDDLNARSDNARSYQGAMSVITEYETIIQRQKRNILSVGYRKGGCVFKRFKHSKRFLDRVKQLGISISTISFKMNLIKLLDKFPSSKKFSWYKDCTKSTREISK